MIEFINDSFSRKIVSFEITAESYNRRYIFTSLGNSAEVTVCDLDANSEKTHPIEISEWVEFLQTHILPLMSEQPFDIEYDIFDSVNTTEAVFVSISFAKKIYAKLFAQANPVWECDKNGNAFRSITDAAECANIIAGTALYDTPQDINTEEQFVRFPASDIPAQTTPKKHEIIIVQVGKDFRFG